ncbi:protease HtpX [Psychrobium sp. 1_MG-2023]|uniref:protease HtpX n=1 Tax=Psychrobium sp. 1_MG-2023 TaxID=3062624 RepID=UPI000C34DDA1|nr:protease HtpX [Psychrobium sp. 1_MG-2023]MDP2559802.1 protease HtpX [Psychrobium sp. 1_MG-2023]PKF59091.1 protease HtpX [Alteromonadales bacterium alter-6D02]
MKRIGLFLLTNIAVMLVLSIVLSIIFSVFGLDRSSMGGLLVLACVFGFGGSFISLLMSKWMAKKSTGAVVIEEPRNSTEHWLIETVAKQAKQAGIAMPEVAIYPAEDMNAFATGASKDKALVAVSTGLLEQMSQDEVEAVLAHEVSHVANGDMITLALIQGIVNTFVIFAARLIAGAIDSATKDENGEGGLGTFAYIGVVFVLEMLFGVLASGVVAYFSRKREFSADAGAAKLTSASQMRAALERLNRGNESQMNSTMMAFGINGKRSFAEFFMSHPPIEKRIAALNNL